MTKKEKLESFDTLQSNYNKTQLALYDVLNHKFDIGVRVDEFGELWDGKRKLGGNGWYRVQLSWRAMPLYLVTWHVVGQSDMFQVWTNNEVMDMTAFHDGYARVLQTARYHLLQKHEVGRLSDGAEVTAEVTE